MSGQRILFFADAPSVHTRRWVAEMVARGHQCWVVTRQAAEVPGAQEVITLSPGLDKPGWFKTLPAIRRITRRLNPDWVHGHYVTGYGLWAAACGARRPTRVALTAWGSDILVTPRESRVMRALVGWSLRRVDLITADSQDVLDEIATYGPTAPRHLILWGADTDKFVPAAQPPAGFDVVSLRSWEANYNIDVIVEGFAAFVAQRPLVASVQASRLHLLGGGPDEAALREQVVRLGLAERVVFHGRVGDAAMVAALQGSRVSVTIPTSDATSVSLLESMACGLPIIASDLPANRPWVDSAGGTLIAPRDAAALARTLLAWADAPERLAAMGTHNRQQIEQRAARRTQMDAMSALYNAPSRSAA
ncbi:glycosyltransferase [Aquabacterium sp.]|uniref:glycosyltransferase n=1 Tax=Aquabacterium sp. TaxID=1872578 RepID=UPI0035AF0B7F